MTVSKEPRFDFGVNWKSYSDSALSNHQFEDARASLVNLFGMNGFKGMSFLDVGCGSGIFAIAAQTLGAGPVTGIDISAASIEASRANAARFLKQSGDLEFKRMDVLDSQATQTLGRYALVYAWGSLHHTGRLWEAIREVSTHVMPGGYWVLAVYRDHWTAPIWLGIKKAYNHSPRWIQKIMACLFIPVIFAAKFACVRKNPLRMNRGMDFYHDVVDWIGGYPYEYASADAVTAFVEKLGFALVKMIPSEVPTGNHQYLFRKKEV